MKSMKLPHVALVLSLVLGMTALWAGAMPVGASGDLVTGGWVACFLQSEWLQIAATSSPCDPCRGTLVRYCYEGGYPACSGGAITVVIAGGPGATPHSNGGGSCSGSVWCNATYDGTCY